MGTAPGCEDDVEFLTTQSKAAHIEMILLLPKRSIRELVGINVLKRSIGIVDDTGPVSVRYPQDISACQPVGYVGNRFLSFPSDDYVDAWTSLEHVLQAVRGLLSSDHCKHVPGKGVHQLAHFREMIFPINADAQQVYFFGNKLSEMIRASHGTRKTQIHDREPLNMGLKRGRNVFKARRRKNSES